MPRIIRISGVDSNVLTAHSSLTTTTNIDTTTDLTGTDVDCRGFTKAVVMVQMAQVSTGVTQAIIQVKMGTTYANYATIDADMTTTANNTSASLDPCPDTVRFVIPNLTTSVNFRGKVQINPIV